MAAKIYRINYKSDFILTMNSDAGWEVPFCIKFWTSIPSRAYYVGYDGETYTHCAYDPSEPTKLVVQFDDHHLPIGDLKFQISYHFTVDDFPNNTEDEVFNETALTTEIDGETFQIMLDFNGETAPGIDFSLPSVGVTSVNGKIGVVTLTAEDVGAQPTIADLATIRSGAAAGSTAVQPAALQEALAGKQDTIADLSTIRSGAAAGATAVQPATLQEGLATKQDVISDLATIRSGAAAGATAVQPAGLTPIESALQTIEALIPSAATSQNKLADMSYVDNKVSTSTANFVGTFETLAELQAVQNPTNNDYGFVIETDALGNEYYDRYKFNGTTWLFEYKVESTPFTADQWAAIQSGITSALVTKLNALPTATELSNQLAAKQDTISDLSTIRSGAAAGATAVQPAAMNTALAAKQDTISDLSTIRSGAAAGATAVQPATMNSALATKQSTISTVNVTVDNNTGTPSGTASVSGSTLSLSFQNLKGAAGATGATGPQGPQGERGLPGESGVTGDVSGFTVIQTIDPSATYGATDIAGAATVQATNQKLTELEGELEEKTDSLNNELEHTVSYWELVYPLMSDSNYALSTSGIRVSNTSAEVVKYIVTAGQKLYLKLSKDNDAVFQFQNSNTVPTSGTNPYIIGTVNTESVDGVFVVPAGATRLIVSRNKTNSTNIVRKYGGDQIQKNKNDIVELGNDVVDSVYQRTIASTASWEQTAANSGYKPFAIRGGKTYTLQLQFQGIGDLNYNRISSIKFYSSQSGSSVVGDNMLSAFKAAGDIFDGVVSIESTPQQDVNYIMVQFNSAYSAVNGNSVTVTAIEKEEKYALKDSVDVLIGNTFIKTINEQEVHLNSNSYSTGYIPCPMFRGVTYLVSLKLIGHTAIPSAVIAHVNASNSEVGRIVFSSSDFASGDYVEFTPTKDVGYLLIQFVSTYREPAGASMVLNVEYGEKTSVSAIDIKPLDGRKFIMLGDSITQLPRTGTSHGGVGIVEWFSHISGAEVIRGAIGGSRLTRTGEKVTTASEITSYNIAMSFFDVIGLAEALASGDFSLQRAAYQWLIDNNFSPDVQMIENVNVLDALDMSTVDAITIFAGTNDWHNSVTLQNIKDAIDSIVETLLTAYPNLTIYFFTPIVRFQANNLSNWSDTWQNNAGLTIPQYVDAIMEQAKVNCVPVCDLYHGMGWTRYNVTQYIPIGDGTHPRNGFGELAAKMFGFVNSNWPKVYRTIQAD